ncbi:sensor histidine kinase [Aminipila sp.]|uniref:sensor histidine kinase n=1 Tax=Aminipila sp. TaxID=2060095 RepID=UPI002899ED59|nr:ATP-binding protein [Aminipila sp.]
MRKKIFKNFFFLSALAIIITTVMISFVMYKGFYTDMQVQVEQEAQYIAAAVNLNDENYFTEIKNLKDRITLIDSQGTVLYDNRQEPKMMENHLERPEVAAAIKEGRGETVRISDTLGQQTFYYAIRLDNGNVIRVANTTSNVYAVAAENVPYVLLICLIMLTIIFFLARHQTASIVAPLNNLDLEEPLSNDVYDEFSPLLRKLEQQNTLIEETFLILNKEREEFKSITQNMNEGLIVLNSAGEMLIVNQRAAEIFGKVVEGHYLTLNRSAEFREVAEKALNGEAGESRLKQDGRIYQLMATPTLSEESENGKPEGVVVLALDITEKEETERIRREFSANVSHELRTPLTSISGYAEIIKEGIAKPEDINSFAEKIYSETKRMIALVEDIMKISKLDEGVIEASNEMVNLQEICKDVIERLEDKAQKTQVTIDLENTAEKPPVFVKGVTAMLDELVFNLCENAIKYNKKGGNVTVKLTDNPVRLIVTDTGIGIAQEHQSRIFERFYCVDKSHSRDTGGTGLGLSIVKHIVKQHKAGINLESEPDKGTKIEITF